MRRRLVPAADETRLSRRRLLTATGAAGAAALAGCSNLDGSLRTEADSDPGETHVRFLGGGRYVGTATYLLDAPYRGRARFRMQVAPQVRGVSSLRLRFKPLVNPGEHVRALLERPNGHPYPEYRFQAGDGYGWTLFEISDLGAQSRGTYTVEFYVDLLDDDATPFEMATELDATFDNGLDPRTLRGTATETVEAPDPS